MVHVPEIGHGLRYDTPKAQNPATLCRISAEFRSGYRLKMTVFCELEGDAVGIYGIRYDE